MHYRRFLRFLRLDFLRVLGALVLIPSLRSILSSSLRILCTTRSMCSSMRATRRSIRTSTRMQYTIPNRVPTITARTILIRTSSAITSPLFRLFISEKYKKVLGLFGVPDKVKHVLE